MTVPEAEHTMRLPCACASGATVASPSARHHHSSTARAISRVVRRVCRGDIGRDYGSRGPAILRRCKACSTCLSTSTTLRPHAGFTAV